jgi:hypothetical protein
MNIDDNVNLKQLKQTMIDKIVKIVEHLSFIKIYSFLLNPLLKIAQKWDTMFFFAGVDIEMNIWSIRKDG